MKLQCLNARKRAPQGDPVRHVRLTVIEDNASARSLCGRLGFAAFGVEPYAIALGERYLAKVHMWRALAALG